MTREPRFRFISEHPGGWDVEVSIHGDSNISQTLDAFEAFLLAAGYSQETVSTAMDENDTNKGQDAHL